MKSLFNAILAILLLTGLQPALAATTVVYPAFESAGETRFPPFVELLRQALEHTEARYGPAKLQPSALPMTESRYLRELQQGAVDVVWSSATEEHERQMLPVRIPIEKGLLGYRVALIDGNLQARVDRVKTLDDLRKLSVGQGLGWGDVTLYRHNGFMVTEADYPSLFGMVANGRFALFPRGVGEIFNEYKTYSPRNPKLAVEKHLLLYYPWPYYFFFNRSTGAALAKRVEAGLRLMIADGSYDAWFERNYGAAIRRANLAGRRVIRLRNPSLPARTPLNDARLWFTPH